MRSVATLTQGRLRGNGGAEMLGRIGAHRYRDASSETFRLLTCCYESAARCCAACALQSRIIHLGGDPSCVRPSSLPVRRRSLSAWPASRMPRPRRRRSPATASVSPTKAGTKSKPKSEKLKLSVDNNADSKTTAKPDHDHAAEHAEGLHQRPATVHGVRRRPASPAPPSARSRSPARAPRTRSSTRSPTSPAPVEFKVTPIVGKNADPVRPELADRAGRPARQDLRQEADDRDHARAAAAGSGHLLGARWTSRPSCPRRRAPRP